MEGLGAFGHDLGGEFTRFDAEAGSLGVQSFERGSVEVKVDGAAGIFAA
jgi:hypothetical protein